VNLLLLDGVMALAESFTAGRSGGLSDDRLRELLGQSPVVAPAIKNRFEGVLTGQQEPWWTAALGPRTLGWRSTSLPALAEISR
jgi:3-hydroxyisobutyrate dehydrogenase